MGQPGAAAAAVRQAEAEGLTLQPSDNAAGYRSVLKDSRLAKPFQAAVRLAGKRVHLGMFATAEEAALAYARTPEAQAQAANPKAAPSAPLTAGEAVAQAAAEGLTLERSSNAAGYKGVRLHGSRYQARVTRAGERVCLGYFTTAEEAALAVARFDARTDPPAATSATTKRAVPPPRPPPAEQSRHGEALGGALHPDSDSEDGINVEVIEVVEVYDEDAEGSEGAKGSEKDYDDDDAMGRSGAAAAAVRQAEGEGLTLQWSDDNAAGYRGVFKQSCHGGAKPIYAQVRRAGERVSIGRFATAEEAALAYARTPEAQAQAAKPKPAPLTAREAVAQAAAEGLTLEPSNGAAGYRGAKLYGSRYQASMRHAGKKVHLGTFATAEEAALAYARTPEAQAEVAKPKPAPLTAREAVAQAAAEGLTLEPSSNAAGYKGVSLYGSRYQARVTRASKDAHLGYFVTAEEAALAVARFNARTDPPAAAPAAAKRAAPPPPKPPPAKQPRHTPPPRPVQPVPPPQRDTAAPQASPKLEAAAAAPAPMIFKDKLALLKRELEIAPATPAIPAVAEANQLMGITPGLGESLGVQLDRLLGIIS